MRRLIPCALFLLAVALGMALALLIRPKPVLAWDDQGLVPKVDVYRTAATAGTPFASFTVNRRAAIRIAFNPLAGTTDTTLILIETLVDGGTTNSVVFNTSVAVTAGDGSTFVWTVDPVYSYELDVGTTTTVGHCLVEEIRGGGL